MATCCFFFKVRTGCIIGVVVYLVIVVTKTVLLINFPLPDIPETIIILNIILLVVGATMLMLGIAMEDRVCVLTFLCFNVCAMTTQAIGLIMAYVVIQEEDVAVWLMVILVIEHIPFLYMIHIGILEYREVKEKHMRIVERYTRSAVNISIPMTAQVPGMGF